MRTLPFAVAALAAVTACSSSAAVDPDAIDSHEKAAVQNALTAALAGNPFFPLLAQSVFPLIDRATHVPLGADTGRIVVVELDINATVNDTPTVAKLTSVLSWRGYDATLHTIDTVVFVTGTGITPPAVSDSIRATFSVDTAGTATAFVIHEAADSTFSVWLGRTGALGVDSTRYGGGQTFRGGGLTITSYRGTAWGAHHLTAKLVPDSSTSVGNTADFAGGIRALRVSIAGSAQ